MFRLLGNRMSFWLMLAITTSCSHKPYQEPIRLYIAASMFESIDSLTKLFSEKTKAQFELNTASTGTLANQIEAGAPADIFFSADDKWVDYLLSKKIISDSCHRVFARNQLVLIKALSHVYTIDSLKKLPKLTKFGNKLAIGDPEIVPAGKYAKQALQNLGVFESAQAVLVYTKDVRTALKLAEMGEAEFAIVYKTDIVASEKVELIETIADSLHDKISLSAALIQTKNKETKAFYEFLFSNEAKEVFKYYGFVVE